MLSFKKIDLQKLPMKKIVIIGQFLVIIFMVRSCRLQDLTIDQHGLKLKMYEGKVNEFTTVVNKLGEKVSTQDQMIVDRDKALEKELLKNSDLSKLNEQIQFQAETKINNILANYSGSNSTEVITLRDTIINDGDTTIVVGIPVGTKFKADTSKWYSVAGTLEEKGVRLDSVKFNSDFTMNIGLKKVKGVKGWLLGKKEPKIELINKNPYTNVVGLKNIKFQDNNKWWNNGWVKFGAGVLAGGMLIMSIK